MPARRSGRAVESEDVSVAVPQVATRSGASTGQPRGGPGLSSASVRGVATTACRRLAARGHPPRRSTETASRGTPASSAATARGRAARSAGGPTRTARPASEIVASRPPGALRPTKGPGRTLPGSNNAAPRRLRSGLGSQESRRTADAPRREEAPTRLTESGCAVRVTHDGPSEAGLEIHAKGGVGGADRPFRHSAR